LLHIYFFCFVGFSAAAQLCSGSLGDPVVNITFSGFGASSYARNYNFVSTSCPLDGSYTITNQTSGCFGGTWHSLLTDHTGGDNFMLVNASFDPGDFYVDTISGLCPNTTYEFAAWIVNVLNRSGGGIRPNITFKIEKLDGTVLASYDTGDIPDTPSPQWKQFGVFFATPINEARIVLRMTNNAPGGIGNDLAIDDITFRPCGADVNANIIDYGDSVHLCEGDPTTFNFESSISSDYVNPVYSWQLSTDRGKSWSDIAGSASLYFQRMATGAGDYWYRLAVNEASTAGLASCIIASNPLKINVHANPLVNAGTDKVLISGNDVTLSAAATGEDLSYQWSPDEAISAIDVLRPVVQPLADIQYQLLATSRYGCTGKDSVNVRVVKDIFVPNAFTPNGDGRNDQWRVPFIDPALEAETVVFNRHGQVVYRSKAEVISWDGKVKGALQPSGVYIYIIKIGKLQFTGTITLIQ